MHKNVIKVVFALMAIIGIAAIVFGLLNKDESAISTEEYKKPEVLEKVDEEYDVVVVGGEPEGVAAAVMAALPIVVIFMIFQKYIATGLVSGSVKE